MFEKNVDGHFDFLSFKVWIWNSKSNILTLKVFEYNGEGNFGELALLYNQPRAATVQVFLHLQIWLAKKYEKDETDNDE